MKHIESIQPEYAAEELERIVREEGNATASAALTALLHGATGCAIPPTADTPESEVEELVPLCLSILRRHWTTPLTALGDGTTPMSLADLMLRLIGDRVQGNESLGIPPANANIPTAVAALCDRHMSSGLTMTLTDGGADGSTPTTTSLPDGLSLAQLLCSGLADNITELQDSNKGWEWTKSNAFTIFPSATSINLNCGYATRCIAKGNSLLTKVLTPSLKEVNNDIQADGFITNCVNVEEVDFSSLEKFYCRYDNAPLTSVAIGPIKGSEVIEFPRLQSAYVEGNCDSVFVFTETKVLKFPELTTIPYIGNATWLQSCPMLEELYMPKFGVINSVAGWPTLLANLPKLKKLVIGVTAETTKNSGSLLNLTASTELVDFRIGEGQYSSMNIKTWNPTTALSERLPEFLSNFKTYIAHRLSDKGSGLTLTLSQAVRDAIQTDPEIVSIITSKGWTISPAPSV